MRFEASNFWYIKLRDYGDRGERKKPLERWGGYDTDFSENDRVYSHEETLAEDHDNYAIVGWRGEHQLVVVDADCHKIDDFEPGKLLRPTNGVPIVKSVSEKRDIPGFHFYCLLDDDIKLSGAQEYVDIKANQKGHVVSPFHNEQYVHVHEDELRVFPDAQSLSDGFEYNGHSLITAKSRYIGERPPDDIDIPDDPPDDMPNCLEACLEARMNIPRDGSHRNPWKVDSALGRRLVVFGYSKADAMKLLEEYPPQDGFDERESSYQMDQLYRKQLHPEKRSSLDELGITDFVCTCKFCRESEDFIVHDPVDYEDFSVPDGTEHLVMSSTARTGKSYTLIDEAHKQLGDDTLVYLSSAHSEAQAAYEKWRKHDVDVAYLVGRERASREYDVATTGEPDFTFQPSNPSDAQKRSDCNAYVSYKMRCQNAQVVVTVPELLEEVGDRDWMMMTEEAAFHRLISSSISVMDVRRHQGYDRAASTSLKKDECQQLIDSINALDRRDPTHLDIIEAAQTIVDIADIVEDWIPKDWHEVQRSWGALKRKVEERFDEQVWRTSRNVGKVKRYIKKHNRKVETEILNAMFFDGVLTYGDDNDNRKQCFIIGDVDMVFANIDSDIKLWTAGNNVPAMKEFHELVHGQDPEVFGFKGGYTPVQKSIWVINYTGGDNPNQQSRHVADIVGEVQMLCDSVSPLIVSGSSRHCTRFSETMRAVTKPSNADDMKVLKRYAEAGIGVAIPENSRFSEGVDSEFFNMGALYNGQFAMPREEYIYKQTGDSTQKVAEKLRAAQNSILRPSDVPDGDGGHEGTGLTPVIVPSMHVPDELFELFEEYDITVTEVEDQAEVRKMLVKVLDVEHEAVVHDGKLHPPEEAPSPAQEWFMLVQDQSNEAAD